VTSDYKAVLQVATPADDRCPRFERGHHGHPVQVALAMKQAGDDKLFRPVRLVACEPAQVADQDVASVTITAEDDAEVMTVVNHDPSVADRLRSIEDPFFVWEPKYGVLFIMTEQGRAVMGTGSITCCPSDEFVGCTA
jgi:hypothetical protein